MRRSCYGIATPKACADEAAGASGTKEHDVPAISRSLTMLLIAAAAASAALSHYVIDVVADYLVPHAAFDDVAHHAARGAIAAIAVAIALLVALRGLRLCCDAATGRGRFAVRPPHWQSAVPFILLTVAVACCAVPAMETLDARLAGDAIGGLADAFGGSILLGVLTTTVCATLVAFAAFAAVRWLLSHRDRIVAAIASAIRRSYAAQPDAQQVRRRSTVVLCQPRLVAYRHGKRAPPQDATPLRNFSVVSGEIHVAHDHCGVLPRFGARTLAIGRGDCRSTSPSHGRKIHAGRFRFAR